MSKATISPEAIWNALASDPVFQSGGPEELQTMFRPYVEALPGVLGEELLASVVSVQTLMKSKMIFIRYRVENGFVKQAAAVIGFGEVMLQDIFESLLEQLEPLVENTAQLLKEYDVTEEQIFADPKYGVRPEVLAQIKAGMTIGDLLVTQPSLVVIDPS